MARNDVAEKENLQSTHAFSNIGHHPTLFPCILNISHWAQHDRREILVLFSSLQRKMVEIFSDSLGSKIQLPHRLVVNAFVNTSIISNGISHILDLILRVAGFPKISIQSYPSHLWFCLISFLQVEVGSNKNIVLGNFVGITIVFPKLKGKIWYINY